MSSTGTCSNEQLQGSLADHLISIIRIVFFNNTSDKKDNEESSERMKIIIVISMILFSTLYILLTIWNAYHISYHLLIWYEYLFVTVPTMTIPNLPKSVTDEYSTEEDTTSSSTKATKIDTNGTQAPRPSLIDPSRPNMIQCYDPSTDEHLGEVVAMTSQQVHECCVKASIAQQSWSKSTFAQRRLVLRTIQKYIVQHAHTICRVSAKDSGKPIMDGYLGEILTTTEKIRTMCSVGELWLLPSYRTTGIMFCYKIPRVEYTPFGIIAPIAPWNYPYVLFFFAIYFFSCFLYLYKHFLTLSQYCEVSITT
jgi:hypothetical protein